MKRGTEVYNNCDIKITLKQINITTARKLFNEHKTDIYIIACNVSLNNMWVSPYVIGKNVNNTFNEIVNSFEYYNCNNEMGNYSNFLVEV